MSSVDWLMAVKVVALVAAGAAFAGWQFYDLAQERRRTRERESQRNDQRHAPPGQTDM